MTRWVASALVVVCAAQPGAAQRPAAETASGEDRTLTVLPVQGRISVLAGAGANITLHIGDDGVLLVDSGSAEATERVLAEVQRLTKRPVRGIINTASDPDHILGNAGLANAGVALFNAGGGGAPPRLQSAQIFAHENVLRRLSAPTGERPAAPFAVWPTDTFVSDLKTLYVNQEPIELIHAPAAHSDGDVMVFFRGSDVVSAGDVFVTTTYPVIDRARGGSLPGVLDALNRIIRITIPAFNQQGGTRVVPGHGRIANEADVVEYRDMVTIVRDRVAAMAAKGLTIEQVKRARPTSDYDGIYGATTGPWTTDMFVEAVYSAVQRPKASPR